MSLIIPDTPINLRRLISELAALGLPDYSGVARRSRDDQGANVTPYIFIKCGDLSTEEETAIQAVIAAHDPTPDAPKVTPRADGLEARIESLETRVDDLERQ